MTQDRRNDHPGAAQNRAVAAAFPDTSDTRAHIT